MVIRLLFNLARPPAMARIPGAAMCLALTWCGLVLYHSPDHRIWDNCCHHNRVGAVSVRRL